MLLSVPGPLTVQVTPWFFGSLVTVAVMAWVWPELRVGAVVGESVIVSAPLPEQPAKLSVQATTPANKSSVPLNFPI
jgi:hypothetical protein